MKKFIAFTFFIIFLAANVSQICKYCFAKKFTIENIVDTENDLEKESKEELKEIFDDFIKEKISISLNFKLSSFSFQLKQYIDHIYQYKNPHHEVDIIPPEFSI